MVLGESLSAVLFDLWRTLAYSDEEGRQRDEENVVTFLKSFNPAVDIEMYRGLRKKFHTDLTTGKLSLNEVNARIAEEIGAPPQAATTLTKAVEAAVVRNVRAYDGAHDVLDGLREEGLLLGLVTNCAGDTLGLLRKVDLDLFDAYGFSDEVGVRKPDPKIYVKVTGELGVGPERCVFVSDEIEDLVGASKLGMRTVHVVRAKGGRIFDVDDYAADFKPDASVSSLYAVYDVVLGWVDEGR
ncbi:Glyceraldehyde 3-phosphate phosphatase [uncultured archaeon]|nr:Glyceraldehyde 3-phosphate phosphatase [uncultured archaeon]